jgi:hypothetical protein
MRKNGFALVTVIVALVLISLLALFFTNLISIETNVAVDKYFSSKAYYTAQAGIENAKKILSENYNWYTLKEGLIETRNDNLDGSFYETYINLPATALKKDIKNNTATLQVFDTSRFPPTNILLLIDAEQIFCTGKTANSFTGCSRGYNGTSKDKHDAGSYVYSVATITSVNTSLRSITVNNNEKFLTAGVLLIDSDASFSAPYEVIYTDKQNNTFYGCDDLSWYTPGTYYVINNGNSISSQCEIISIGFYKNVEKKIQTTLSR